MKEFTEEAEERAREREREHQEEEEKVKEERVMKVCVSAVQAAWAGLSFILHKQQPRLRGGVHPSIIYNTSMSCRDSFPIYREAG